MRTPDVVVIGGGFVGLAASIELAERGASIIVLERELPGAVNSIKAPGGIRQQFGSETNIRLARLSAPIWDTFEARFGVNPEFRRLGYLFLGRSEATARTLADQVALQHQLEVDTELLGGLDISERWPSLTNRGFTVASFRQGDGFANQFRIVDGMVRGALAAGVELRVGTEALSLEVEGDRVVAVMTSSGRVPAGATLLATGAWLEPLLGPLGIRLPVEGHRHELLLVEPAIALPVGLPWLIGVDDSVHLRPDIAGRVLVGGFLGHDAPVDPDQFDQRADRTWTRSVLETAAAVFGLVGLDALVRRGWAGLYPSTPDRHPIVDRVRDGLYVAVGFAGTGLMMSPGAARLCAELILDGAVTSIDPTPLSVGRFAGEAARSAELSGF